MTRYLFENGIEDLALSVSTGIDERGHTRWRCIAMLFPCAMLDRYFVHRTPDSHVALGPVMIWLGETRGSLTDWVTQLWVRFTGQHLSLSTHPWLAGPTGDVTGIGLDFFDTVAEREGLTVRRAGPGDSRGLLTDLDALSAPDFDPSEVHPDVAAFYQETSEYDLDAWAQWCGIFRPFGWLLATLFSRRLQQLNVPLSGLDTSRGVTSEVIQLVDSKDGTVRYTGWVRQLLGSGDVLYAGSYSTATVPGREGLCVKVVFPLPNGNAIVLMRPEAHGDGSLSVVSAGRAFGDPGFYFTVRAKDGTVYTRYLRSLKEGIRVYPTSNGDVRADHSLTLWGLHFLQLHYRLRRIRGGGNAAGMISPLSERGLNVSH